MTQFDGRGWDAPPPRQARPPFERTGGFLAMSAVLVIGAAVLGFFLGGGTSGDSVLSGSPTGTDTAQQQLQALLPEAVYRDCASRELSDGQVAALRCTSATPGAEELLVSRFDSAQTMATNFAQTYAKPYADGKCGTFTGGADAKGTGRTSTWKAGKALACYVNSNSDAVLLWEYPEQAVQVIAVRKDPDSAALWSWWSTVDKTLAA